MNIPAIESDRQRHIRPGQLFPIPFTAIDKKYLLVAKFCVDPSVAKAGALQSQGNKGEAVAFYCDPLVTPDMECSGFP